jgi:hypothetical protein
VSDILAKAEEMRMGIELVLRVIVVLTELDLGSEWIGFDIDSRGNLEMFVPNLLRTSDVEEEIG